MSYRVFWAPNAEEKLDLIIHADAEPAPLVAAARQIDQYLLTDPTSFGESRYDTIRVGFVYPPWCAIRSHGRCAYDHRARCVAR
jgi:hypothetical protein